MTRASEASIFLGVASVALWVVAVRRANFPAMGPLGLISVLDKAYFLGLGLLVVAISLELLRTVLRPARVISLIVVLVLFLYGTACAIEPVASLTSAWVHAGYVNYVTIHGHALDNFAAEFSWPGGFSLGSVVVAFAGQTNAVTLLRWFPLVIELLYLAPLLVIARHSGVSRRAGLLGVAIFYSSNWIYQDYFSSQALGYLLFLVVVACVFAGWRPRPLDRATDGRRRLGSRASDAWSAMSMRRFRGLDTETDWDSSRVLWVLALLVLLSFSMVVSHQLTPYALGFALAACLVTRRLGRPELLVVVWLFAVGWLSLGASNYWANHLGDIFGQVGSLGSIATQNVGSRITGSASHRLIVDVRILLTGAVLGLAGIGALRRAADSRTLEALTVVPFFVLLVQSYGGEGLLRVVLFSLPFASLLAASALLPKRVSQIRPFVWRIGLTRYGRPVLAVATAVVLLTLALATTLVRGGNDAYESYSRGELAAVTYAYAHTLPGLTIAFTSPYLPIGQTGVDVDPAGTVLFGVAASLSAPTQQEIFKAFVTGRPTTIVLSKAQESWGEVDASYRKGWEKVLQHRLVKSGYRVVASWPTAVVLQIGQGT